MSSPTDLCDVFAELVASTRFEGLPVGAVEAAKKTVLDTLGVILAGSGMEPAVCPVIALARDNGGREESTILGFGGRAAAVSAALANGAMAHCLDFDDRTQWGAHVGSSIVPAVLALAERVGGVSGKRLIAAIAAGQDMFVRLRCNVKGGPDWNLSTVLGVYATAASAGHVLGLGRDQIISAMSVASQQSGATMQIVNAGRNLRGMYAGFSASAAVQAALLAEKGITGIDGLFEGKAGLLNVYFGGKYDRSKILEGLGQDYLGVEMVYKPWPVVGIAHTYIHAVIQLMKEHRLDPADVEQIRVHVNEYQNQTCSPLEHRRAPQTAVDAKYSLPYCVALAAINGQVRISDFTPSALQDAAVCDMAAKVQPVARAGDGWTSNAQEGRVEVVTRDGRTYGGVGDRVPGSLQAPMTWDELAQKFRACAPAAATPVAAVNVEQVIEQVARLETLPDVSDVISALG